MPKAKNPSADDISGFDTLAASALLRKSYVARLLSVHIATIDRKVAHGILPRPIDLGGGSKRWRVGDLRAFLARGTSDAAR